MGQIIIVLFGLSFFMFFYSMNRKRTFRLLNRDEREKYKIISKKPKTERSEEEQDFYLQTQESFYSLLTAKYSFVLAVLLVIIYKLYIIIK